MRYSGEIVNIACVNKQIFECYVAYLNGLRREAEQLYKRDISFLEDYFEEYFRTGDRQIYENQYFIRRKHLMVSGIVSIVDREERCIQYLEKIIQCICDEETWALPAHINLNNIFWRNTVDLFAAETAQALAEIISQLKGTISEKTCSIVIDNIRHRVLNPFFNSSVPYANWENGNNNWNAVCCGSIGSVLLDLYDGPPEKWEDDVCLNRIISSLEHYLDGFSDDGVCPEGLAYLNYGLYYYLGFACKLKDRTGGRIDIIKEKEDKLRRIAGYLSSAYFKKGAAVSFSDSDPYETFRLGLVLKLNLLFPEIHIPCIDSAADWDTDFNYRWLSEYRDVFWTREWLEKNHTESLSYKNVEDDHGTDTFQVYNYPLAQQTIIHGIDGIGIGIKGGHNAEPHNHNDLGSFSVVRNGKVVLADIGYGQYDRDYFNENRYQNLCTRSAGHNVPIVDGLEQGAGNDFRVSDYVVNEGKGQLSVIIDFGKAYGKDILLTRKIVIGEGGKNISIEDASNKQLTEHLITYETPIIDGTDILIGGCRIRAYNGRKIEIESQKIADHRGNPIEIKIISIVFDTLSKMEISL